MLETLLIENEQEDYEENYWRDRITGETGVEIRTEDEIFELFMETIVSMQGTIEDWYHLDECFDYIVKDEPGGEGRTQICSVQSNAVEEECLEVYVEIIVDEDMNGNSTLKFEAVHNGRSITSAECYYHNGSGREGDDGACIADSDSEFEASELDGFKEEIFNYVKSDLNPFVRKIQAMENQETLNGKETQIADFPCECCGNYGISIAEELFPIGKCCYCGYENEISTGDSSVNDIV